MTNKTGNNTVAGVQIEALDKVEIQEDAMASDTAAKMNEGINVKCPYIIYNQSITSGISHIPFLYHITTTANRMIIPILTLAVLLGSAICAQRQMVPGPFNVTAYTEMMDCVKNASTRYHVAIEHGTILIIPPEGEYVDLDSDADKALGDCLDRFSSCLQMAVDNGRSSVDDGAPTQAQEFATAEWAESNGANGMTIQDRIGSPASDVEVGALYQCDALSLDEELLSHISIFRTAI